MICVVFPGCGNGSSVSGEEGEVDKLVRWVSAVYSFQWCIFVEDLWNCGIVVLVISKNSEKNIQVHIWEAVLKFAKRQRSKITMLVQWFYEKHDEGCFKVNKPQIGE
jgi:hypothetical protein